MFDIEGQMRALNAAKKAAHVVGVSTATPVVLRCSRHICALLPDLSIVARVTPATAENFIVGTRELHVTRYLREQGAPVVGACEMMPSEPLIEDEMVVTLWPYVVHEKTDYDDDDGLKASAHTLQSIHDVLADYPRALPTYAEKIEECVSLLRHPSSLPALAASDREFLMRTYEQLWEELRELPLRLSPIHGDAHLGNVSLHQKGRCGQILRRRALDHANGMYRACHMRPRANHWIKELTQSCSL